MTPEYVLLACVGAVFGSFAVLAADRLAVGENFIAGRSRCDLCARTIRARDLIPVVSWLALRGRAVCCGGRIPLRLLLLELLFVSVPLQALTLGMQGAILVATCALGWTLLGLGLIDLAVMRLPDALTLPLTAGGLALAAADLTGPWAWHTAAAVLGFALVHGAGGLYQRVRGQPGMGGGDARLLMAAGAWTGPGGLLSTLLLGCMAGLLSAIAARRAPPAAAVAADLPPGAFPFGPALALGLWVTWLLGPVVTVAP